MRGNQSLLFTEVKVFFVNLSVRSKTTAPSPPSVSINVASLCTYIAALVAVIGPGERALDAL